MIKKIVMKKLKSISGIGIVFVFFMLLVITACNKEHNPMKFASYPAPMKDVPAYSTTDSIMKKFKIVWQDEFNGTKLNPKKWRYRDLGKVRSYATVSRDAIGLDGD